MAAPPTADTFECGEEVFKIGPVLEVASATKPAGDLSGELEQTTTDVSTAHKAFKGKVLEGGSDVARTGYSQRSEFAVAGSGERETLEERCNRLRAEVQELVSDLAAAEKSSDPAEKDQSKVTVEMTKTIQGVSDQLEALKLNAITGDWVGPVPAALQADLNAQLLKDLAAAKQTSTTVKKDSPGAGAGVTYELYYNAEQAKLADAADVGALDLRISKLEKALGTESLARAAAELGDADLSITSAVTSIAERAAVLETESTQAMSARLQALLTLKGQAEAAIKSDGKAPAEEYVDKVNSLYTKMQEWDSVALAVPELITRLTALKGLHERGADFGKTLSHLTETQNSIAKALGDDKAMLDKVEASFATNMGTIEKNFSALDSRIEALTKNLGKLKK